MRPVSTAAGRDEKALREELSTVFKTIHVGVVSAALASVTLCILLTRLGIARPATSALFAIYICVCALAHLLLRHAYLKQNIDASPGWRRWGAAFAVISFFEGIGWGMAPIGLVANGDFASELLCLLVSLGIAGGAIPALSPYFPAFLAFFIPSTIPYAVHTGFSPQALQQGTAILMVLYVVAMATLGVLSHRSFRRLVDLRLKAEVLAEELKKQIIVADAANRSKSSFLAAASHDLRQPVHALSLFVGALRGMPMSADAMVILEKIEASSQAMDDLFAALLDISRLDAGIVEVTRRAFPIAPLLERIRSDHAAEARAKGIELRVVGSGILVDSDPVLLERIIRNLVSNAVRYTQHGRVVIGCRRRGAFVSVAIHDTGPGIPLDQRDRIFEEYYQLENVERDRSKGLGLGLAIVRRLTALLGCDLTLRSDVGRGSSFAVLIPQAAAVLPLADPAVDTEAAEARHELSRYRGRMIVVIDDEANIRAGMSTVLDRWGYQVVTAGSGADAIAQLALCPLRPDLIISDFRLREGETGLDVVEALRLEYNSKIPAILITGDTAPERLIEARDSGLLLMHKPVSNGRLRAAITNVVTENMT